VPLTLRKYEEGAEAFAGTRGLCQRSAARGTTDGRDPARNSSHRSSRGDS